LVDAVFTHRRVSVAELDQELLSRPWLAGASLASKEAA
jgi:hypothetical protein